MVKYIRNELYLILHNTWLYKIFFFIFLFYGILTCQFIIYAKPVRIDNAFIMYYPVIFFVWLVDFILPGIIWYINFHIFHRSIHDKSFHIPLLKGYSRRTVLICKVTVFFLTFFTVFLMSILISYFFAIVIHQYDVPLSVINGRIGNQNAFAFVLSSHILIFIALQPMILLAMIVSLLVKSRFLHMVAFFFSITMIRFLHLAFYDIKIPIYRIVFTYYEKAFISFYDTKIIQYETNVQYILLGGIVCIVTSFVLWIFAEYIIRRKQL